MTRSRRSNFEGKYLFVIPRWPQHTAPKSLNRCCHKPSRLAPGEERQRAIDQVCATKHGWFFMSVEVKFFLVIDRERLVLCCLADHAFANYQRLHLSSHEAAERVLRSVDDRLASHIETCIDQH